jgi:hypothetical protein
MLQQSRDREAGLFITGFEQWGDQSLLFDIYLIIIALMLVGGVVLRVWQRRLTAVRLQKVSPAAAAHLVGEFILSSYDGQFGYPTGLFRIEEASDRRVVAQEIVERQSQFAQILGGMFRAVLAIGAGLGCIGGLIGLTLAVMLSPFLVYAAIVETILKYLLRSRIVADIEAAQDGATVAFTLRGPVALLVGQRLEHAFNEPTLPPRLATLAGIGTGGSTATPRGPQPAAATSNGGVPR